MTWLMRTAIGAAAMAASSALIAAPQGATPTEPPSPPASAPQELPDVLPAVWIHAGGPMGGGTASSTALRQDEWQEMLLWSGQDGGDICSLSSMAPVPGTATLPSEGELALVRWRIAVRRVAFDGMTATIEVRWRREVEARANLQPDTDFDGAFTWRASEGDSRVLDLVRQVPAGGPGCDTQAITLQYRAIGADALREAAIIYELWLVQRLPSGASHTRRIQTTGRQDDAVRFAFPTVGIDAPGVANSMGPSVLDVAVEGQVRGRVRRDGRLDIAVDAGRIVGPRGQGLMSGSFGRTQLTVAPGETVELEPPPLYASGAIGPFAAALARARTAIRVRATRLW